jgi:hypothetical protein
MILGTHSNFHKTGYRHRSPILVEPLYRHAPGDCVLLARQDSANGRGV